ncbi:hypothetical protein [Alkalimonas amylolytica]|uniref:SnoaL-like domain-containing protein n=1 Tax=Alkalimonas amylolytica TaxID=152573 RepID=A0A1H4G150_ALKAM|nr:hypothetical protein [Alkalimonas amylolytica]SEB03356.1 hypothetical protein SAMN04488051_1164 [Alkalimonas amylolytica]
MRVITLCFTMLLSCAVTANQYVFETWVENMTQCALKFDAEPNIHWDGKSELPISFQQVQAIFSSWAESNLVAGEAAHVTSYELASVAADGLAMNHWVFKIKYVVFENNVPSASFNRKVALNLSGQIIEADCGI